MYTNIITMSQKIETEKEVDITLKSVDDLQSIDLVKSIPSYIKKVDEDGDVSLYSYISCDEEAPDVLKHARGLVYYKEKLAFSSFAYSDEYVVGQNDEEIWKRLEKFSPSDCVVFESHEGFLVRVFYLNEKWYLSTNRKLDASKSRWSSNVSYGETFEKSIESEYARNTQFKNRIDSVSSEENDTVLTKFLQTLDKNLCYVFLTLNTEDNRIVCDAPKTPTVYHVGVFKQGSHSVDISVSVDIPYPKQVDVREKLLEFVSQMNIHAHQGVIVYQPDGSQFKIYHPNYKFYYDIRGNEASIRFRYLQLRMNTEQRRALEELYPGSHAVIDACENTIYLIARHLKNLYVQRYIHKQVSTLPSHEFKMISECHKWHRDDRVHNRVSIEKLLDILNNQPPTILNKFIRDFTQEEDLKKRIETLNTSLAH